MQLQYVETIEADREADRKVIQTRNNSGKLFTLGRVEKQSFPILLRDTEVELPWFYMSQKSNSLYLFLSDHWFSATIYLCIKLDQIYLFIYCCNKSCLTIVINGSKLPWGLKHTSVCPLKDFYSYSFNTGYTFLYVYL